MAQPSSAPPAGDTFLPASGYVDLVEAMGAEVAQYSRETFENAGQTARGLLSACTFEDVVRLQTDFAKRSVEGFVARSAKLSELGCSLFGAWTARAKL